jgi:hypothetical protein
MFAALMPRRMRTHIAAFFFGDRLEDVARNARRVERLFE